MAGGKETYFVLPVALVALKSREIFEVNLKTDINTYLKFYIN